MEQDGRNARKDEQVRFLLRGHGMRFARRLGFGHRNELWLGPSLASRLAEARREWRPEPSSWGCAASAAGHCCGRHRVKAEVLRCEKLHAQQGITY